MVEDSAYTKNFILFIKVCIKIEAEPSQCIDYTAGWTTGVQLGAGWGFFLFVVTSRPALGAHAASDQVGTGIKAAGA
jgi:hypothetical protein